MIQGKGLDSKLRMYRNEATTFFAVGLGELSSDDQEYLKGLIRERTNELARSLEDAEKISGDLTEDAE